MTGPDQPVSKLRGAGVDVDRRRLAQVAVALVLVGLAATSAALFAVGAHENSQVDQLRGEGIVVEATVGQCLGLLGGSGSNAAGYSCDATYVVGGHRYRENLPGAVLLRPGSRVRVITAANDPTLIATPATLSGARASWQIFIVPVVLLVLFTVTLAMVIRRWRRERI